jgi:Nucleotidyl transferase of unknown function (DUF2204)
MSGSGSREDGDLLETLKEVAVALKRAGVRFALGGGYATYARGGPSSEHDVDFVLRERDVSAALTACAEAGLEPVRAPEDWLVKVFHGARQVDLIFRMNGCPVSDEVLDRADEMEVQSILMPVLDASDLIVGKLLAFDAHNCDFGNALATVRALREQVHWPVVRARAAESPYAVGFLVLAELLGIVPPPSEEETTWPMRRAPAAPQAPASAAEPSPISAAG